MNEETVYRIILEMIRFPFAQICRHNVAMTLLDGIEQDGGEVSTALAKALCAGSNGDHEAERLVLDLLENLSQKNEKDGNISVP